MYLDFFDTLSLQFGGQAQFNHSCIWKSNMVPVTAEVDPVFLDT